MSDGFDTTRLGDLIDVKHGYAFEGRYFQDQKRHDVLVTPGNFAIGGGFKDDKLKYYEGPVPDEYILQDGELIVTMTDLSKAADTLGYPALVPRNPQFRYLHNQRIGKVIIKRPDRIDRRYLFYLLRDQPYRQEVLASATGTTVKHTSPSRIINYRFNCPQLAEQRAIASTLGALDDKIELNRKMNETLEATARAIFQSWFVDFDPVRAKVEGRRPFGMDDATAALFPDSFQDSPLGKIPERWKVGLLGELCSRVAMGPFGSDIKTDNFVPNGVPIIRGGNLTAGFVDESFVYLTDAKADELRNANAFPGDIVITHRGTLGQVGIIPIKSAFPRYVVSQSQLLLSANPSAATSRFIFDYLVSVEGQRRLLANTSQTGVPAISRPTTSVKAIQLVIPPVELQRIYAQRVGPLVERSIANQTNSRTLALVRDSLLPKLMSGELRVKDAEKLAGERV